MSENDISKFNDIPLTQWDQSFRVGMAEYAAITYIFTTEGPNLLRIAFGNAGPFIDSSGNREPRYTHAVTLTPETALDLAQKIIMHYAKPSND
ncbi:hypothetical protein [Xanthobacter autotrophicus]|uniref:hypothetical protein n=1 Tax=Xanthobacter autotrophicus TaxID=280 RepID=UPI003729AA08